MPPEDASPEFEVRHEGPEFIYMQVADHVEDRIRRGDLRPGTRLPAERDLADQYGVAYLTIRRAAAELRERGLIRTIHGRGTYVTAPPPGD